MATIIRRSNKAFPFTNRLPLTDGAISQSDLFWRGEFEWLFEFIDQQAQQDFDTVAEKIYQLEQRIEALE